MADLRQGLSAKSCPLASCCRYSCKAQIILSVWGVLHLYGTQPLSFLVSLVLSARRGGGWQGAPRRPAFSRNPYFLLTKEKSIRITLGIILANL